MIFLFEYGINELAKDIYITPIIITSIKYRNICGGTILLNIKCFNPNIIEQIILYINKLFTFGIRKYLMLYINQIIPKNINKYNDLYVYHILIILVVGLPDDSVGLLIYWITVKNKIRNNIDVNTY